MYHNEENFNLLKYLNKKNYYGKSFQKYIKKWGKNDPDVRKQFSQAYRFVWVFLEKGKWKKLLRHPFLAFSMYFLRIVVGLQFILYSNKE